MKFPLLVLLVSLFAAGQTPPLYSPDSPPRASLIQISAPDATSHVTITGAPGAVLPGQAVFFVTLDTGHAATTNSGADGSFSATLFAPAGTSVIVKAFPPGLMYGAPPFSSVEPNFLLGPAGTILRVPEPAVAGPGVPFSGAGVVGGGQPNTPNPYGLPAWTIQGTINASSFAPGDTLTVNATLSIASPALKGAGAMQVAAILGMEQLTGPSGLESQAYDIFSSTILTPTGFPIERTPIASGLPFVGNYTVVSFAITQSDDTHAQASLQLSFHVPASLPAGLYRPCIALQFTNVPSENPPVEPALLFTNLELPTNAQNTWNGLFLPLVRLGTPASPQLFWTLLADDLSNGSRGVRAMEDQNRFGLSLRVLTQSETFIVPRVDPVSGAPLTYRLEPFVQTVSVSDRQISPFAPLIPFRFPSGGLTVRIQNPDGSAKVLGPVAFAQSRMKGVADQFSNYIEDGPHPANIYQLSTMDPRFEVQFPHDGLYVITLSGSVDDIWGNTWTAGGTYNVYLARTLSLDTAVLPGTPFEVGNAFDPSVVLTPPVPATVNVRFRLAPNSDSSKMIDQTINGLANRFGYFHPPNSAIALSQPGEYRADFTASYTDAQGNLWMGSRTWGGVVAPTNSDIIGHGQHGTETDSSIGQWFFYKDTGSTCAVDTGNGQHIFMPFNSGDVIWMQRSCGVAPTMTFQDPLGAITGVMAMRGYVHGNVRVAASIGEVPLFSSRPDGLDVHIDPSKVDLWGYSYISVQRPLVRVREQIGESEGVFTAGYWRFQRPYMFQIGMGGNGDLPNDIKFQYGAAVVRGTAVGGTHYAIYGSQFVLIPDNDPNGGSRIFPPFEGNGGGPTGGPIMTLKGRKIDLFMHLTGVRPGSILETGDTFGVTGAVGPPLPAFVSYSITTPSGKQLNFSGRANKVGHYYQPADDFVISEPGIYAVNLNVTYDGQTSAGQVTAPFPTGDVLGTSNGQFFFYAVPRGSPPLVVNLPADKVLTPPILLTIPASAPTGFSLASGHFTTTMPGFLLETGALTASAGQLSYQYNPQTLAGSFPNLDVTDGPGGPPDAADVITTSLFSSGTGPDGKPAYAARMIVLHGAELFDTGQTPVVPVISSVTNAESGASVVAANTWIAIAGSGLAPDSRTWQTSDFSGNQLPQSLDGVTVTMNGKNAYVYYISPGQINVLTPPDLNAGAIQVQVTFSGLASAPFTVQSQPLSPSFFVIGGGPYVLATHADGTLIGPPSLYPGATTPASSGETVVVYANGLGSTSAPIVGGSESQSGLLIPLPKIQVAGMNANVRFAGLISPGLYQIDFDIPVGLPPGDNAISATLGGSTTQAGTLITVQP